LKKYFYVLRPLLAVRWLERYGTAAPIEFSKLLHLIGENHSLLADIDALLEQNVLRQNWDWRLRFRVSIRLLKASWKGWSL
jgi:predicted nucleotidyltransferase